MFSCVDYAKITYKLEDPNIDDMRYEKVATWLLKHDWCGGKVNQFKHYTKKTLILFVKLSDEIIRKLHK